MSFMSGLSSVLNAGWGPLNVGTALEFAGAAFGGPIGGAVVSGLVTAGQEYNSPGGVNWKNVAMMTAAGGLGGVVGRGAAGLVRGVNPAGSGVAKFLESGFNKGWLPQTVGRGLTGLGATLGPMAAQDFMASRPLPTRPIGMDARGDSKRVDAVNEANKSAHLA